MSAFLYVQKRGGPITPEDLNAAAERVPHYAIREVEGGLMVEVPCGDLGSAWLDYLPDTGVLALQLGGEDADQVLAALRRFAGCIPGAFVDAEGQEFGPLPWDGQG